jgi:hypothetical protein
VLIVGLATARSCGYRLVGRADRASMLLKLQMKSAPDLPKLSDDSQNTADQTDN